jgi:hypothetical protein
MSVRDLEQEGVLPVPAKSYGSAEFSILTSIVDMQSRIKRLEEVVASLCAKQTTQAPEAKGFYIKEEFRTP